jgi:hypothetical protein
MHAGTLHAADAAIMVFDAKIFISAIEKLTV